VAARCPFTNEQVLQDSIDRGKGTILVSAHWGGWEIAGLAIMSMVKNVLTVARPLDNELLEADLQKLRAKTGAEVVDRRKAARALMRGLAENAIVVLLPDQAVLPREGVLAPFLGRPAWTTPAPAKLALRADATIVFAFCKPDGLRHRLEFEEPIRMDQLTDEERDPAALTRRINEVISRRIRERPELWLWMHDRWKGTGESETHVV
jgi:KDO2-lipid IV(A) lauroyltransferase